MRRDPPAQIGQVYQLLHELERRGLVVRRDEDVGSRARRVFGATPRGEKALGIWLTRRPSWPAPLRDEIFVREVTGTTEHDREPSDGKSGV